MINIDAALKVVLKETKALNTETVKLTDSLKRVLGEDIYAQVDIPGFDNSAMDGYALRASDTKGASKNNFKLLEVITDLKAGDVTQKILKANQAARIMTGAPIPKGTDGVIMVEDTKSQFPNSKPPGKEYVKIYKEVKPGENIRKRGEDIKKGELIIKKGTLLHPAHIGILTSLGKAQIKVTRKPKVAILATGDELVDIDEKLAPAKVRSSNTYILYTQVLKCGGIPKNLGIAKDNSKQLEKKITQGLDCDIILTSGGVSVGKYDFVKDVLARLGTNIRFWKVAMRPGKPLVFGLIKGILIFGLPGNPVSSMVSFEVFVRPAILKMLGQTNAEIKEADAVLEEDITKKKGIRYFLRAQTRWEDGACFTRTSGPQGSSILKSMASANSLIILPEELEFVEKGTPVTVRFLE